MSAALAVSGLTVAFGGLVAVSDFGFSVAKGTLHALIGPNGAGKSTVLNCISRFHTPSAGAIRVEGRDLLALPAHKVAGLGIARTFQNLELFAELSVLDNVMVARDRFMRGSVLAGMLALGPTRREQARERDAAMALIERVGLAGVAEAPVGDLPYGQRKLAELARALALEPSILLLDEPAAGMNGREARDLGEVLVAIQRERGLTVLLVEHNMALVMAIAERITVMNHGKFLAEGRPREIERDEAVIAAYLGGGRRKKVAA